MSFLASDNIFFLYILCVVLVGRGKCMSCRGTWRLLTLHSSWWQLLPTDEHLQAAIFVIFFTFLLSCVAFRVPSVVVISVYSVIYFFAVFPFERSYNWYRACQTTLLLRDSLSLSRSFLLWLQPWSLSTIMLLWHSFWIIIKQLTNGL